MAIESRNTLRTYFETGDVPSEQQFGNLIDSYISLSDDGVYIFEDPVTFEKKLGVGIVQPTSRLGVKAHGTTEDLISLHNLSDDEAAWLINMFPDGATNKGFNIEQQTAIGGESRLFINELTGNVGLGTLTPEQNLHIERSNAGSIAGVKLVNLATVANQGWSVGHLQNPLADRDGGLAFIESGPNEERMILSAGGNLGVNELEPKTSLHVGADIGLPLSVISLIEDSGTAIIGPITDNLVFDYMGIQARHGEYVDNVLEMEIAPMALQPLGGDLKLHGDPSADPTSVVLFTDAGFVGVGMDTPVERIDVTGAIRIGANEAENEGTIRWTGTDFEGRNDTEWLSLTAGGGKWTAAGDSIYYNTGTAPRAAVGTDEPDATLQVNNTEAVTLGSTAAMINSFGTTTSTGQNDNRISLQIQNIGSWGGDVLSKDVGLYVSRISGQAQAEVNIAAVLNGNVVIGNLIAGSNVIGRNGRNVLAFQNGIAPITAANPDSVQLYASDFNGESTLHVLRGNNETIKLYQESALTAADNTPFPVNYDATTIDVLNNMRLRIEELESKLQAIGMLA